MPPFKEFHRTLRNLIKTSKRVILAVKFDQENATFKVESSSANFSVSMEWDHLDLCKLLLHRANREEDRHKWNERLVHINPLVNLYKTFQTFRPTQVSCTIQKDGTIIYHFYQDKGHVMVRLPSDQS